MSSLLEDISKLQPIHIQNALGVLLSVIAPGFLIVLHFWPKLFFDLDNLKLFFLAISLSLPVLAMNTLVIFGAAPVKNQIDLPSKFFSAMLLSFVMLYLCLFAAWILKLSFIQFVVIIIALEFCGFVVSYITYVHNLENIKRAHQKTIPPPDKQPPS